MKINNKKPNFFVCGLSGSGKDEISNFLWDNYGYRKLRIAKTLKLLVCEVNNLTPAELELEKRLNLSLRKQHKTVSDYMDEQTITNKHNLNRLEMLIYEDSYDFEILTKKELENKPPKVFIDVRGFDEAKILLENGYIGIFLKRGSDNDVNKKHWTEKSIFAKNKKKPSQIEQLVNQYGNQCYIVNNINQSQREIPTSNYLQFDMEIITGKNLCDNIDENIFKKLIH